MLYLVLLFFSFVLCAAFAEYDWKSELDKMQIDIKALQNEENEYHDRLEFAEMYFKNVTDLSKMKTNLDFELKPNYRRRQASTVTSKTAFSAHLSKQVGNLGDYQVIVFDDVVTNDGNTYNHLTGIFRCPETGLYAFYTSILSVPGCYITTQIAKNGKGVAWTFSLDPVNASTGQTMVVLQLVAGDEVNIRINGNAHYYRYPQIAQLYCSFTRFRLV